jgi:hypothetical protein
MSRPDTFIAFAQMKPESRRETVSNIRRCQTLIINHDGVKIGAITCFFMNDKDFGATLMSRLGKLESDHAEKMKNGDRNRDRVLHFAINRFKMPAVEEAHEILYRWQTHTGKELDIAFFHIWQDNLVLIFDDRALAFKHDEIAELTNVIFNRYEAVRDWVHPIVPLSSGK